jgi:hypothetical protein
VKGKAIWGSCSRIQKLVVPWVRLNFRFYSFFYCQWEEYVLAQRVWCKPLSLGKEMGCPLWVLPLKVALLSTLKTCLRVWTGPWGNLLGHCNQSLLPFIFSFFLFPFQVLFLFF